MRESNKIINKDIKGVVYEYTIKTVDAKDKKK